MPLSQLPQPLLARIVEDADTLTLKACALTCRALIQPTRSVLHRTVSIRIQNVHDLSRIYSSPEIAQYVRQIYLKGDPTADEPSRWMVSPTYYRDLRRLLSFLVSQDAITKVVVCTVVWKSLETTVLASLELFQQHLLEFGLDSVVAPSPSAVYSFIIAFERLSILRLSNIVVEAQETTAIETLISTIPPQNIPRTVTTLYIEQCHPELIKLLALSKWALHKLSLADIGHRQSDIIRHFLRYSRQSLTEFAISMDVPSNAPRTELEALRDNLNLTRHSHIRHLRFFRLQFEYTNLSWPRYLLETLQPTNLKRVTLEFEASPRSLTAFYWEDFSKVLSKTRFSAVQVDISVQIKKAPAHAITDGDVYFPDARVVHDTLKVILYRLGDRVEIDVKQVDVTE